MAGLLLLGGACGAEHPADSSGSAGAAEPIDLLLRSPDEIRYQSGILRPTSEAQWGKESLGGWEEVTHPTADGGHPFVFSKALDASLLLEVGAAHDRELALRMWSWQPDGSRASRVVSVFLNEVALGEVAIGSQPQLHRLPAPAPAWHVGANVLRLSVDQLTEHPSGALIGLALASVRYGQRIPVDCDPRARRLVLHPDTGVRYDLESGPGTTIRVHARCAGAGTLELVLAAADPEGGSAPREVARASLPVAGDAGGELEYVCTAGEFAGEWLLAVDLAWASENGAKLELVELSATPGVVRERPPVIFIVVDTLAAANMSLYGYERATTPRLQELAADAVTFERCTANAPWTVPSMMSLMTGVYPIAHTLEVPPDLQQPQLWEKWMLAENRWTLAESLRATGYDTAAFIDSLWLNERFGMAQGFETFDTSAGAIDKTDAAGGIRRVTELARSWLEAREPGRPFFLLLHCFDVHGPYSPDEEHRGRFRGDARFDDARSLPASGLANVYGIVPEYIGLAEYPGERPEVVSAARLRAAYDEGIALADGELGLFFDWLKERGLYDASVIVVTADHGEALDSGPYYFGHGLLHEDIVHVPLLFKLPWNERGGARPAQAVQSVDLFPTIQELAGQSAPSHLHGRSFLPLLFGRGLPPAASLCEGGLMEQSAVEHAGWRLVTEVPGSSSSDEMLLTYPGVADLVRQRARDAAAEAGASEDHSPWRVAAEFVAQIEARGLTPELFEALRQHPQWAACVALLRAELTEPRHRLYDLAADPEQRFDLAASRPDKLEKLLSLGALELAKGQRSRALALGASAPVELGEEEIKELGELGYVELDRDD